MSRGRQEGFASIARVALTKARSAVVVMTGLLALVLIATVSLLLLTGNDDSQNVVTLATAAFGVVGAIVGAYFGVNASANARDAIKEVALGAQQSAAGGEAALDEEEPGADVDEAAVYGESAPADVTPDDVLAALDEPLLDDDDLEEAAEPQAIDELASDALDAEPAVAGADAEERP